MRTGRDGKLSERPFRLEADGRPDIHDIYRCYDEGYTVVLNGIHWRSPVVGALCRELEADFQHHVGVNLYLTPRGAQGLRPHLDSHNVVIVQIHGVKEWRVGAAPRYEMKGIRLLVGRALVDPAFRARALNDADAAVAEFRGQIELPENVHVHCVENSAYDLTIVLPPPSQSLNERSQTIRDFIFSRTSSEEFAAGVDDDDVMPIHFPAEAEVAGGNHFGDPSRDGH